MFMNSVKIRLVIIGVGIGMVIQLAGVGIAGERAAIPSEPLMCCEQGQAGAKPNPAGPVTVPEGNGAPVITDGIFSPGEWDDALRIRVSESVELCLKNYRGVVFVGIRGLSAAKAAVGPSELSLAVPGGQIHKFHVSAQLYEVALPSTGPEPRPRFGFTQDWYANELRRDMEAAERLEKEGKSPFEIIQATSYPTDGIEFAIRRSKLPGERWLMRLWVSAFVGGKPGMFVYPSAAAEKTTEEWLELRLK